MAERTIIKRVGDAIADTEGFQKWALNESGTSVVDPKPPAAPHNTMSAQPPERTLNPGVTMDDATLVWRVVAIGKFRY